MTEVPLWRRATAELVGTGALVCVVVGSGIMAASLSPDDVGLQLLENSTATGLGLCVLIVVLGPVSGAHFNPVVTLVSMVRERMPLGAAGAYVGAQAAGAAGGCVLANLMFDLPAVTVSTTVRDGPALILAEVVATTGLVVVILGLVTQERTSWVPPMVGAYIAAAYWFTASTSFANPAVTFGRILTDTFAGIAPESVPGFVLAQLVGGAAGLAVATVTFTTGRATTAAQEPAMVVSREAGDAAPASRAGS
ncbi:MAG: aquaporin [Dermatophilaceae bacterium]